MINQNKLKKMVAIHAIKYIKKNSIIGIGTGSTVNYFINELDKIKYKIKGAVSSSTQTSNKLKKIGIPIFELNNINSLDIYIDSADEINYEMQLIKGGGAALTREKIIASASNKFICIADNSKLVNTLGAFPLPIEIIPMAKSCITKEIIKIGGFPIYRKGVITDNGNIIIDVKNLKIINAKRLEHKINMIPGVVTVGLFAHRTADIILISSSKGLQEIKKSKK